MREIDAQEIGETRAIGRRVQHSVDITEDFFGGIMVLVAPVYEGTEIGGQVLKKLVAFCVKIEGKEEPIV